MQNPGLGTEYSLEFLLCHPARSSDVVLSYGELPPAEEIAQNLGILNPVRDPSCDRGP